MLAPSLTQLVNDLLQAEADKQGPSITPDSGLTPLSAEIAFVVEGIQIETLRYVHLQRVTSDTLLTERI